MVRRFRSATADLRGSLEDRTPHFLRPIGGAAIRVHELDGAAVIAETICDKTAEPSLKVGALRCKLDLPHATRTNRRDGCK